MATYPQKLALFEAIVQSNLDNKRKADERKRKKEELLSLPYLKQESDPFFFSSPASLLKQDDLLFLRTLPSAIATIKKQQGPPGSDGYTPVKGIDYHDGENGQSIVGPKGDRGPAGKDGADASIDDVIPIVNTEVEQVFSQHTKQFDHSMLHESTMLGGYVLDVPTLQEGDFLQVKGKKIVGIKPPQQKAQQTFGNSGSTTSGRYRIKTVTTSYALDPLDQILHVEMMDGKMRIETRLGMKCR